MREGALNKKYAGSYICNVSVTDVMNARNDDEYLNALEKAAFNLPNSSQLVVEMHTQGYPLAKQISVFDLMKKTFSSGSDIKHYFVCENSEIADCIELSVKDLYPEIKICGAASVEDENIINDICEKAPDIVWVGIGGKKEALWLKENAELTEALLIGVGYGISSIIKGTVWNNTRRFSLGYVLMNIKYLLLTGKKFLWTTLSWTPALMTIMTIFILSSQTGEVSKTNSGKIAERFTYSPLLGIDFSKYAESAAQLEELNSLIRFFAHIGEYAFLSLCIGFAISVNGIKGKIRFIYMCMLGLFVSLADEIFQLFIPNRYGDLYDVMCDFLGVILVAFFMHIFSRRRKANNNEAPRRRKFLNIHIDDITFDDAVNKIIEMAKEDSKSFIVTPNVDHVIKNEKDILFRKIYERADLILTDGTPLMWIADSLGAPIKEKIPGSDMLPRVCELAAKENLTIFFLGASEGVAEKAKEKLTEKYPGLNVIGCYSPPIGFEINKPELEKTISIINEHKADILVASLGSPKQEKFIYNYMDRLEFKVALPFGAALDFEAGHIARAPLWMRKSGLEWFFRFLQEPKRLFKRYFIDDIKIFWIAWKYRNEIIRLR